MIIHGDSFEELKKLDDNSIDSLVTDPPYGLSSISATAFNECMIKWCTGDDSYIPSAKGFMGKSWDSFVPPPALWKEVYRVLKPGAHGLVFAGSRTQDLMGLSLRLAGFEIRDCVTWLYGSGFPKSHDVSKAIDKLKGCDREQLATMYNYGKMQDNNSMGDYKGEYHITTPSSNEAKQWDGWGTALKPAYEPALLIRKPLKCSVAQNVLEHGTGAINIDGCRIDTNEVFVQGALNKNKVYGKEIREGGKVYDNGRFPSNVIIDDVASDMLKDQARFFYCSKASPSERSAGLNDLNIHPTVKPIEIMRYLCRLITPPSGTVLEPFLGSGTTAIAALKEGFNIVGIEREAEYVEIAKARLAYWAKHDHAMTPQNIPPVDDQLGLGF